MNPSLQKLYLIRHGDTEWTESRRHTGLTDIPLNRLGEENAKSLAIRLAGKSFARVFTSPLQRARKTAEIAGFGMRAEIAPELVEWNYGAYDGLTTVEIKQQTPDWHLFRDGAPGGESPADVATRAKAFIAKVQAVDGDVAAFSSGHFIRVIAACWLGLNVSQAGIFYTATASIGVLGYEHDETEPVVLLWNSDQRIC